MIELILLAGYTAKENKPPFIARASTKLDLLKFFLQTAWEIKCLDHKQYAALASPLTEVGRMLEGWRNHFKKETTSQKR